MKEHAFTLARLRRAIFDSSPWYGFIVSASERVLLLQSVSDRYDLDGYRCIRRSDVTSLEEQFPRRDLIVRAMRLKQLHPAAPAMSASNDMRTMMEAVQGEYGLLTIHREAVHADECEIGQIRISTEETYVLRSLNPDARWDPDDRQFKYADVTRLDFGGEYERTLLMVSADRELGA